MFSDGKQAYRGCTSDEHHLPGKQFCAKYANQCRQCPNRGCNDDHPVIISDVSCIKCTSTNNIDCISVENNIEATRCAPFAVGYINYCFTHLGNGTVSRGCILENTQLHEDCNSWHSISCQECLGNNCNNSPVERENCIECNSKQDSNCTNKIADYMHKECPLSFKKFGCYRSSVGVNGKYTLVELMITLCIC